MKTGGGALGLASILCALALGGGAVVACGFDDPSGASTQRGILNFSLPNSLHVMTAVWQAQLAGVLPASGPDMVTEGPLGFRVASIRMRRLGRQLGASSGVGDVPAFSVVLLDSMLWTTYQDQSGQLEASVHAKGPLPGHPVLVTDQVVIAALLDGTLNASQARDFGLLRYYGDPAGISRLSDVLDRMEPVVASQAPSSPGTSLDKKPREPLRDSSANAAGEGKAIRPSVEANGT